MKFDRKFMIGSISTMALLLVALLVMGVVVANESTTAPTGENVWGCGGHGDCPYANGEQRPDGTQKRDGSCGGGCKGDCGGDCPYANSGQKPEGAQRDGSCGGGCGMHGGDCPFAN